MDKVAIVVVVVPIRRIGDHRIHPRQRRQDFEAIAVIQRRVANLHNVAHAFAFRSSSRNDWNPPGGGSRRLSVIASM